MPQIVLLAAIGAGVYAGYKVLGKLGAQVVEGLARAEADARQRAGRSGSEKDLGQLDFDPKSGVYRPRGEV